MQGFHRIGITIKSDLSEKDEALHRVLDILKDAGAEVRIDAKRIKGLPSAKGLPAFENEEDMDLLLVIGGDGTILRAVRELKNFSIPILSINRGTIGFLAEMRFDEAEKVLPPLLRGEGVLEERSILRVDAKRGDKSLFSGFALNEAVISQGSIARLLDLKTTVNGEDLTTFRADGLIIATPTGSTAYSLAAGGPIVHPGLSAAILTPINSHTFTQKPIVIPGRERIEAEVLAKKNKFGDLEVSLTIDGQTYIYLQRGDRVTAMIHTKTVTLLRRKQETFYATLREKLKWGETPEE